MGSRGTQLDSVVVHSGDVLLPEAKRREAQRAQIAEYFVAVRNSLAHGDISSNNVLVVYLSDPFTSLIDLRRWDLDASEADAANKRALARALAAPRITSAVRLVLTPCNLLKVLKRVLRLSACRLPSMLRRIQIEPICPRAVVDKHDWFRIHGPRPPRQPLKRLVSCFKQTEGVFLAH